MMSLLTSGISAQLLRPRFCILRPTLICPFLSSGSWPSWPARDGSKSGGRAFSTRRLRLALPGRRDAGAAHERDAVPAIRGVIGVKIIVPIAVIPISVVPIGVALIAGIAVALVGRIDRTQRIAAHWRRRVHLSLRHHRRAGREGGPRRGGFTPADGGVERLAPRPAGARRLGRLRARP